MELPNTSSNENFETSRLLLEKIKEENLERKFLREGNNTKIEIFKPEEGYAAIVTESDEKGKEIRQSIFTKQEGLITVLNTTIDQEENRIPKEGRIVDIKEDGLIISTTENYIILPENGNPDVTDRS
jgi:hypothetical protein